MSHTNTIRGTIELSIVRYEKDQIERVVEAFNETGLGAVASIDSDGPIVEIGFNPTPMQRTGYTASNFRLPSELAYVAAEAWKNGVELVGIGTPGIVQAANESSLMLMTVKEGKVWVDQIDFEPFSNLMMMYQKDVEVSPKNFAA